MNCISLNNFHSFSSFQQASISRDRPKKSMDRPKEPVSTCYHGPYEILACALNEAIKKDQAEDSSGTLDYSKLKSFKLFKLIFPRDKGEEGMSILHILRRRVNEIYKAGVIHPDYSSVHYHPAMVAARKQAMKEILDFERALLDGHYKCIEYGSPCTHFLHSSEAQEDKKSEQKKLESDTDTYEPDTDTYEPDTDTTETAQDLLVPPGVSK